MPGGNLENPVAALSLPGVLRRPLGRAWRAVRPVTLGWVYRARAQRILRAYSAHYAEARERFMRDGPWQPPVVASVRELNVRVVRPGGRDNCLDLPADFLATVERVSAVVRDRLGDPSQCVFVPPLPAGEPSAPRTADVPAVGRGDVLMIQLKNPLEIPGLEVLCAPLIDQLERRIFSSHVLVERVYVYRTPVSLQAPQGSWLWHYDNHPHEILKMMVYLTDVTSDSGPFEYLRCARFRTPLHGSPVTPIYGSSRIPVAAIQQHLDAGYEEQEVTGPMGTTIVFDNNVVHRATVARGAHRDVIVLQVRPALVRLRPCVSPSHTGSFQHAPFSPNPHILEPTVRRAKHFS